ncbi:serine hydrolase [Pseudoduganella sp. LjRoot289]|uniref:serine hydrolase n=1 Tax=Pseudoduganella sp. LjRoot289 TaxID=3342314 RepID=UPI003ECFDB4B
MFKLTQLCAAVLLLAVAPMFEAQAAASVAVAPSTQQDLVQRIDAIAAPYIKADGPGMTLIVTKDGKTLYRKAYGMADVMAKTPMQADMALRLGSITKQFTAVAVMLLADEGKLAVADPVTKYLPDFPEHGITIEHLLTHTSGIVNYTDKANFPSMAAQSLPLPQMIDLFRNDPLDFKPGTQFKYSNSGYFLLGAIIEKVSGTGYAAFLRQRIFTPLGMDHTGYGDSDPAGIARASGHAPGPNGVQGAGPMNMAWPYSAGALTSNVDDLARWNEAIRMGKLLKPDSWKRVFSPYTLAGGKASDYGYGWNIGKVRGHASWSHGGAIPGFRSEAAYLPKDGIYVAALSNMIGPGSAPLPLIVNKAAALAAGDAYPEPVKVSLSEKVLDGMVGVYQINDKATRVIRRDGDHLVMQRSGGPATPIWPQSETGFFMNDSLVQLEFQRDASGKVTAMSVTQDDGSSSVQQRISDAPPAAPAEIKLANTAFDEFVGRYEIAPNFIITVSRDGDKFVAQATNQPAFQIFPRSETRFFVKVVDAELQFDKDASGKVSQMVLHQNGRALPGKRL